MSDEHGAGLGARDHDMTRTQGVKNLTKCEASAAEAALCIPGLDRELLPESPTCTGSMEQRPRVYRLDKSRL